MEPVFMSKTEQTAGFPKRVRHLEVYCVVKRLRDRVPPETGPEWARSGDRHTNQYWILNVSITKRGSFDCVLATVPNVVKLLMFVDGPGHWTVPVRL